MPESSDENVNSDGWEKTVLRCYLVGPDVDVDHIADRFCDVLIEAGFNRESDESEGAPFALVAAVPEDHPEDMEGFAKYLSQRIGAAALWLPAESDGDDGG